MQVKSIQELIRCAERELAMRKKAYPGRVLAGRMSQADMQHEIDCMTQIAVRLGAEMEHQQPEFNLGSPPLVNGSSRAPSDDAGASTGATRGEI